VKLFLGVVCFVIMIIVVVFFVVVQQEDPRWDVENK
jgi:hypothetical protein